MLRNEMHNKGSIKFISTSINFVVVILSVHVAEPCMVLA